MAESFMETGDFFATSGVPRTDSMKLERRYYSLINTVFWAIVVLVPMLYYIVKLFLSGSTVYFSIGVTIILLCKSILFVPFTSHCELDNRDPPSRKRLIAII